MPHVEVEMVRMGRVIVRPERNRENPAGALVHSLQEGAFLSAIVPMRLDIDEAPVLKAEARDVDGICPGMFRPAARAGNISAGEAAIGLDPRDRRAENLYRRRPGNMPLPEVERSRLTSGWSFWATGC